MSSKMKFIAEISANHNNSFDRCKKLIDEAKRVGFWGVKFQLFFPDELYNDEQLRKLVEPASLDIKLYTKIAEYAKSIDMKCSASVFEKHWYETLAWTEPDFIKIASSEILMNDRIKEACHLASGQDIPLFISDGMASEDDLDKAVEICESNGVIPIIFHCSAHYPASLHHCEMKTIINNTGAYQFGWSDHTVKLEAVVAAYAAGAKWTELHLDLDDKEGYEYQFGHCWTVTEAEKMIAFVDRVHSAMYSNQGAVNTEMRCNPKTGKRHPSKKTIQKWVDK